MKPLKTGTAAIGVLCIVAACDRDFDNGVTDTDASYAELATKPSVAATVLEPGPPSKIPAPDDIRPSPHAMDLAQVQRYIDLFDHALTKPGLDHLAASALAVLADARGREAELLRRQLHLQYNRVAPGLISSYPLGYEGAGECDVDFDDPDILNGFPDAAENTFVVSPFWVQPCGDGDVKVEPTVYNHYHLVYEDPTIDCFDDAGHYGRGEPGNCVAIDPALEPRSLGSMGGDEVIRIRLVAGGTSQPFTLHSFANVGNESLRVSYKKDGTWYLWPSLGGNVIWDVSDWVIGVTEVRITSTLNSDSCGIDWEAAFPGGCLPAPSPFFVDDFSISP